MGKLVLTCALAGGTTTQLQTPYLLENPEEMTDGAYRAPDAGAHVVHIHAKDAKGKDRSRADVLNETIQ